MLDDLNMEEVYELVKPLFDSLRPNELSMVGTTMKVRSILSKYTGLAADHELYQKSIKIKNALIEIYKNDKIKCI